MDKEIKIFSEKHRREILADGELAFSLVYLTGGRWVVMDRDEAKPVRLGRLDECLAWASRRAAESLAIDSKVCGDFSVTQIKELARRIGAEAVYSLDGIRVRGKGRSLRFDSITEALEGLTKLWKDALETKAAKRRYLSKVVASEKKAAAQRRLADLQKLEGLAIAAGVKVRATAEFETFIISGPSVAGDEVQVVGLRRAIVWLEAKTPSIEIALYGSPDVGFGWIAAWTTIPGRDGGRTGTGEPVEHSSRTDAVLIASRTLETAGISGEAWVYDPTGTWRARFDVARPPIYGQLKWEDAPVLEVSAQDIIEAAQEVGDDLIIEPRDGSVEGLPEEPGEARNSSETPPQEGGVDSEEADMSRKIAWNIVWRDIRDEGPAHAPEVWESEGLEYRFHIQKRPGLDRPFFLWAIDEEPIRGAAGKALDQLEKPVPTRESSRLLRQSDSFDDVAFAAHRARRNRAGDRVDKLDQIDEELEAVRTFAFGLGGEGDRPSFQWRDLIFRAAVRDDFPPNYKTPIFWGLSGSGDIEAAQALGELANEAAKLVFGAKKVERPDVVLWVKSQMGLDEPAPPSEGQGIREA